MPAPRRSDIRFDSRRPATTLVIVIVMMIARMVRWWWWWCPRQWWWWYSYLGDASWSSSSTSTHFFSWRLAQSDSTWEDQKPWERECCHQPHLYDLEHIITRPHCYRHKNHWSSRPTIVREVLEQSFATSSSQQDDGLRVNIGETLKRNEY